MFWTHHTNVNVKVLNLYSTSTRSVSRALWYSTHCQGITQFYLHTLRFIHKWNELYPPFRSQPQLVLIYRPWRGGRLSRPCCEVALAEIRTCNLPIANPALYHTATSTHCATYSVGFTLQLRQLFASSILLHVTHCATYSAASRYIIH